jgi:hypothetical protein
MVNLARHWRQNAAFRAEVRRTSPHQAAAAHGFQLDDEDRRTLNKVDWNLTDEQIFGKNYKEVSDWG